MQCPYCGNEDLVSRGYKDNGKHQYFCKSNHINGESNYFVVDERDYSELPDIRIGVCDIEMLPAVIS